MRRYLLSICMLFVIAVSHVQAQRELKNPLLDSKQVIQKGVELNDAGKYKEAVAEFLKVPPSDTGYSSALHEIILSYYNDSNYTAAERYGKIALDLYPDQYAEW